MKIATYNVNGVNGHLPVLLRWLNEKQPDVVCLQELKAPQEKFPEEAIKDAGYKAHLARAKKLEWCCHSFKRRKTTGNKARTYQAMRKILHSRYIEATVNGITIGCLYLPNGNPAPGPKFDYKLNGLKGLPGMRLNYLIPVNRLC